MNKKAIGLMSGGLDSSIAVKMIHDMGIEIYGVHFTGPFCMCNRGKGGCIHYAKQQAKELGITFKALPLGKAYIDIVVSPAHGYGSGVNPCIDCRIMMFMRAKQLMEEQGASFIFTGEVLGQRPMSQLKDKLRIIERDSGLEGLILRPLSAQHMAETIPEKEGIVDRSKLLSIEGRSRKPQMDLVKMLEIGDYPCPAGGCLLTDKPFAAKVKDAIAHEGLKLSHISLLKTGRHFRLPSKAKLVVGRDKEENERLESLAKKKDILLTPTDVMGPSALLRQSVPSEVDLQTAAKVCASYCNSDGPITFTCRSSEGTVSVQVEKVERSEWDDIWVSV